MGVQGQRAGHAAAQRVVHDKVEGAQLGQGVAFYRAMHGANKVGLHAFGAQVLFQQGKVFFVVGNHRQGGPVAFVAGAGVGNVAQQHVSVLRR